MSETGLDGVRWGRTLCAQRAPSMGKLLLVFISKFLVFIGHTCSFDRSPVLWTTGGDTEDARVVRAILDSFAATCLR